MLILPAIDLKGGRCVRLYQGARGTERVVAEDPVSQAKAFRAHGARRLHVVDLDGAFDGRLAHLDVIRAIVRAVDIPVQVGGGLRSREAVEGLLEAGVAFAILGTMLVDAPDEFARIARAHPGKIIAGLDFRDGLIATKGWEAASLLSLDEVADRAVTLGAAALIVTDIARDGTGHGVNVQATAALAARVGVSVFASGGVFGLEDIRALVATHVAGVVVGRALYDGRIDLPEAIEAAARH